MRREKLNAPAVAIIALDGMQSQRWAAPPTTSRSTRTTRAPRLAARLAAWFPPGPPPMTTTSVMPRPSPHFGHGAIEAGGVLAVGRRGRLGRWSPGYLLTRERRRWGAGLVVSGGGSDRRTRTQLTGAWLTCTGLTGTRGTLDWS